MTVAQQFFLRAAVAAVLTALVAYAVVAFIAYDQDTSHWTAEMRTSAAVSWLFVGGFISFCAGISALKN